MMENRGKNDQDNRMDKLVSCSIIVIMYAIHQAQVPRLPDLYTIRDGY